MATVFTGLKSSNGNPYVYHTLSYTLGARTETTQVYNFTLKSYMGSSSSSLGTGYAYSAYINVNNTGEKAYQYKASNNVWSGTTTYTTSFSYTANIGASVTSVPLKFRTVCTYAYDGDTSSSTTSSKSYTISANEYIYPNSLLGAITTPFNIDEGISNIAITKYNNNYYDRLQVKIGSNIVKTIDNILNGDSVVFTNEELGVIYNLMSTVRSANLTFELSTWEDNSYTKQLGATQTRDAVGAITNANPIFSNFTYEDVNSITLSITKDSSYIIKGYSTCMVSIGSTNKAIGQKGASISYYLINGNAVNYADSVSFNINNIDTSLLQIYAVDTRGNSTLLTKVITNFVDYSKLVKGGAYSQRSNGGVGVEVTISVDGSWWNNMFNATQNNLSGSYRYKLNANGYSWIEGKGDITFTTNGSSFLINQIVLGDYGDSYGFNPEGVYVLELTVSDALSSINYTIPIQAGNPAMAIYNNKVALGGAFDETKPDINVQLYGKAEYNGSPLPSLLDIYPIGSIYMNTNNVNPQSIFGGVWQKIEGRFLLGSSDDYTLGLLGGEATHILKVNEIPSHNHRQTVTASRTGSGSTYVSWNANNLFGNKDTGARDTLNTGGGEAHNNMPPYLVVNIWKRTA